MTEIKEIFKEQAASAISGKVFFMDVTDGKYEVISCRINDIDQLDDEWETPRKVEFVGSIPALKRKTHD